MGARFSLVWLTYKDILTPYIAAMTAIIALGFSIIYIFGLRKTGAETMGQPIWWNNLRPVHAVLYGATAYLLFRGNNGLAWKILLVDTLIGLGFFMRHHLTNP